MRQKETFAEQIIKFYSSLSNVSIDLPDKYKLINPFNGNDKAIVQEVVKQFYNKFYNDNKKRKMILGSSPARRGTAVTGVPFEDAWHIKEITGIDIENFYISKASSNFLYDVMDSYGGCEKFYNDFYMNFVCPLGITRINEKGNEVNCNYYENKKLKEALIDLIVKSIKEQIQFGIDTRVCYCIGSGENYDFLTKINNEYHFFDSIVPLEHPRFIMQYNSHRKDEFLKKYLDILTLDVSVKGE